MTIILLTVQAELAKMGEGVSESDKKKIIRETNKLHTR